MSTQLDDQIRVAIAQVAGSGRQPRAGYIESFRASARGKARNVLETLHLGPLPRVGPRPVFVSIGGGDGTELAYLLEHSEATHGILLERDRESAERARKVKLVGKDIHVIERDAQDGLADTMRLAASFVAGGRADFQAVTCHAVIHELFDRSGDLFDPTRFFGTIFSDSTIPTWFTYREPGVPEKWPKHVILQAQCGPDSLLQLALLIHRRHRKFQSVGPEPYIFGDHVRLHKDLAMETLVKLFYLEDLAYELEERSTSVDHQVLGSTLMMAIGDRAVSEQRGNVWSASAPTGSFMERWRELGICVSGYENGRISRQPLPESQTRVIAWRVPDDPLRAVPVKTMVHGVDAEISLAAEAHRTNDGDLLKVLVIQRGRAWIESSSSAEALRLLLRIKEDSAPTDFMFLWSHYLTSLSDLFAGRIKNADAFSLAIEETAAHAKLDLLFRSERMEFLRKLGRRDDAIPIANSLLPLLNETAIDPSLSSLDRYVLGTAVFLLNNFLRSGGAYHLAWRAVSVAASIFVPGTESHEVELAHCHYASGVCVAMTGVAPFETGYPAHLHRRQFAGALIQLAYSHAAWSLNDVAQAERYALDSAAAFDRIGTPNYARRARELAALLKWWKVLQAPTAPLWPGDELDSALRALTGDFSRFDEFATWFPTLRPSRALGLLQFAAGELTTRELPHELMLPQILRLNESGTLEWSTLASAKTLAEADVNLRVALDIPPSRRLPLLAD